MLCHVYNGYFLCILVVIDIIMVKSTLLNSNMFKFKIKSIFLFSILMYTHNQRYHSLLHNQQMTL